MHCFICQSLIGKCHVFVMQSSMNIKLDICVRLLVFFLQFKALYTVCIWKCQIKILLFTMKHMCMDFSDSFRIRTFLPLVCVCVCVWSHNKTCEFFVFRVRSSHIYVAVARFYVNFQYWTKLNSIFVWHIYMLLNGTN